MKTGYKEIFL